MGEDARGKGEREKGNVIKARGELEKEEEEKGGGVISMVIVGKMMC